MKKSFLLTICYAFFVILILPQEVTSGGKIRVAILDFKDKSSPPSPETQEKVQRIFEDIFIKLDSMIVERELVTTVQKGVEEMTQGIAKIIGSVMDADLVVMGDYKIEKEVLSINSYFIDIGKKDLKDMNEKIIRQIKEMGIKRINIGLDETAFLSINMIIDEEKREEEIVPFPSEEETTLFITSRPENARIYINNRLRGLTPQVFKELPPSVYRIRLVKNGLVREETIVLKKGERLKLDIDLYDKVLPPLLPFEKEYPAKLFVIQTPFPIPKGRYHVSIDYPEVVILRYGVLKEGLEARIQGLGIGVKYRLKWLGFSLLYKIHKKKDTLDIDTLFSHSGDTPLGIFDIYYGLGFRFLNDPGLRYFIGFETYLLPKARLLMEYDRYEGSAAGFRLYLPYNLNLTLGLGLTPKGKIRYDANLSYSN